MSSVPALAEKRRDAARTKDAILRAAQATFSTTGYAQTGLREIAARAGINAALVARYFGSKEALFEAALRDSLDVPRLLAGGRAGFGRHVAGLLCAPLDKVDPTAILVLAAADAEAKAVAIRLLEALVIDVLARWLDVADAETRAAEISILCTGYVVYRRLLPIAALADGRGDATVAWLAEALQAVVDR